MLTQIGALEELRATASSWPSCASRPFYPAGGGQVTDAGCIELDDDTGPRAELRDAYRFDDDQVLLFEGTGFAAGDRVRAVVPWGVRFPTMANHTATHLLHEALRRGARRPRQAGRLGRATRQAPLRLHARRSR